MNSTPLRKGRIAEITATYGPFEFGPPVALMGGGPWMLRIETISDQPRWITLELIGDLAQDYVPELENLIGQARGRRQQVVLDLRNVGLVDREALRYLVRAKKEGVRLAQCPPYVAAWIGQEMKTGQDREPK